MKRNLLYINCVIFFFFLFLVPLKAETTGSTGNYQLYIRISPDASSASVTLVEANERITILNDTKKSGNGCNNNWFQVKYKDFSGFSCSTYISDIQTTETPEVPEIPDNPIDVSKQYEEELKKFPAAYQSKIEALHKIYPNAVFKSKKISGINWNTFLTYEYQGYTSIPNCPTSLEKGVSLYWDNNRSLDGRKSTESWAYNFYTDIFNQNFSGGGANWYIPSKNTVAYYLDPRNFLNTTNIFMFEDLTYNEGYYTIANIEKMLKGTFMANAKIGGLENKTYAEAFIIAGKESKVSPYALVSRVIQELGASATKPVMVSGTYPGYTGYYNFYNIGAYGNSVTETIVNGLKKAKTEGWNSEYKALVGGANFVGKSYITQGQNTLYSQKFDTDGPCYARHQYMQNIQAPESESYQIAKAYQNAGLSNSNFVFVIPVYDNMPTTTTLDNPNNPNNYLKSLTVNGNSVDNFDGAKTEYTINVSPLISSVEIAATKVASTATVTGTGKINLTGTSQIAEIKVKAANGNIKTYKITITRDAEIPIAISEILNTMLISSDGTNISSIKLGTTAQSFIDRAKEISPTSTILVQDKDNKVKTEEPLATGDQVKITSGEESKTFTVIIYGDLTGDGIINSGDLLKMRQHLIKTITLTGPFEKAANVTKTDEIINSGDLLKMRQHLIGMNTIEQ